MKTGKSQIVRQVVGLNEDCEVLDRTMSQMPEGDMITSMKNAPTSDVRRLLHEIELALTPVIEKNLDKLEPTRVAMWKEGMISATELLNSYIDPALDEEWSAVRTAPHYVIPANSGPMVHHQKCGCRSCTGF